MPLVDSEIRAACIRESLIDGIREDCISSCGYDLRLSSEFKIPILDTEEYVVDPFLPPEFQNRTRNDFIIIPPHNFILGCSIEYVCMPSNLIGICLGRSTYARAGIITNVTPLEPGWKGQVTIEISNTNPLPVKVYVNEGITQVVFFQLDTLPTRDYAQKQGKYQGTKGVVQGRRKNTILS